MFVFYLSTRSYMRGVSGLFVGLFQSTLAWLGPNVARRVSKSMAAHSAPMSAGTLAFLYTCLLVQLPSGTLSIVHQCLLATSCLVHKPWSCAPMSSATLAFWYTHHSTQTSSGTLTIVHQCLLVHSPSGTLTIVHQCLRVYLSFLVHLPWCTNVFWYTHHDGSMCSGTITFWYTHHSATMSSGALTRTSTNWTET